VDDLSRARVLIVKPSAFGDIIHSLPFLAALKNRYPHCSVEWVVAHGLHEFLEGHPLIDRLWIIRKNEWRKISRARETARELRALYAGLRASRFDLAVDLQGLLRSGLIALASGAPVRVGFAEAREGSSLCYTHKVRGGQDVHAIERNMKIAEFLGCVTSGLEYPLPPLPAPPPGLPARYAVMAPSAGKEANRWPARRFGELASRLTHPSVVVASAADAPIAEEVVAHSQGMAISLAGLTSLKEMASVIRNARFMISNDTGPMHVAAAMGVPVFAIFGPANPARTGPYGVGHTIVTLGAECAPCYRKRKCRDWKCLSGLGVDDVYEAIKGGHLL
jgi:lipopolysaccharide heptosyltransferase I